MTINAPAAPAAAKSSAQAELAHRKLARRRLIPFCTYVDPKAAEQYRAAHLQLLAAKLEAVERGEIDRLMVFMPNRHWKSSLASKKFPAWFIGKRAKARRPHQVMIVSYGATLAEEISAVPRDLIRDNKRFQAVFPNVLIAKDKQAGASWGIRDIDTGVDEQDPSCVAAGMNGGITGKGADLLIIDDPVKNAIEAQSSTVQAKHWNTWTNDLRTRLNPGAAVVLIMTRWAEDDIAGQLLRKMNEEPEADQWEVLVLPALAYTDEERVEARRMGIPLNGQDPLGRAPGEALWPERYDDAAHAATRANDEAAFIAIGQQMPRRPGGYLIGRDNFKRLTQIPTEGRIRWCIPTDWALTEKQQTPRGGNDPDYTAAGLVGMWWPDPKNSKLDVNIVIAAIERCQERIPAARRMVKDFALGVQARLGKPVPIISGQANVDKIALDDMRGMPDLMGWAIYNLHRYMMPGDKVVKSEPWRSRAYVGRVYLIDDGWWGTRWNEAFILEAEGFPKAAHDDQIDLISVAMTYFVKGQKTKTPRSYSG